MTISWIQAILLGIFASLSSMPGMGGSSIGNYTLGRPLVGGLISGLILGDVTTGIMVGVALGLSKGGNIAGALFYIVVWNLLVYLGMRFAFFKGYHLGDKAVEFLVGPKGQALRKAISVVGGMVIGAVAATWVSVTTALEFKNADGEAFLKIQEKIDGVYPGLLTAAFITLCWWLMAKKKVSPNKVMLLLVIIALAGVALGIFDPGLKY